MEPSTLDPRQKDLVGLSFCRGSRVEGSLSRVAGNNFFFNSFFYKNRNVLLLLLFLIKIVRGHSNSLKSKEPVKVDRSCLKKYHRV